MLWYKYFYRIICVELTLFNFIFSKFETTGAVFNRTTKSKNIHFLLFDSLKLENVFLNISEMVSCARVLKTKKKKKHE